MTAETIHPNSSGRSGGGSDSSAAATTTILPTKARGCGTPCPLTPPVPQGRRKRQRPHEEAEAARVTEMRTTFFQRGRRTRRQRQIVQFSNEVEQFMFFRSEEEEEEQADETRSGNSTCTGWYTKLDYERMEQDAVSDAIQSRQEQGIPGVEEACAKAQRWGSMNNSSSSFSSKDTLLLQQHHPPPHGGFWSCGCGDSDSSNDEDACLRQAFDTELRARRSSVGRGLEHWTSMALFMVRVESRRSVRHVVLKAQDASRHNIHQADHHHHHQADHHHHHPMNTTTAEDIAAASRNASRASRIYARFWGLADAAAAAAETEDEKAPLPITNNSILGHPGPKAFHRSFHTIQF